MAYRVKAGYVTVQTSVGKGRAYVDIPRDALVPEDVPAAETEWLLRSGQIEEIEAPVKEEQEGDESAGSSDDEETEDDEGDSPADELDGLDKEALVALAKEKGVTIDGRWGADKIAAAIRDAQ